MAIADRVNEIAASQIANACIKGAKMNTVADFGNSLDGMIEAVNKLYSDAKLNPLNHIHEAFKAAWLIVKRDAGEASMFKRKTGWFFNNERKLSASLMFLCRYCQKMRGNLLVYGTIAKQMFNEIKERILIIMDTILDGVMSLGIKGLIRDWLLKLKEHILTWVFADFPVMYPMGNVRSELRGLIIEKEKELISRAGDKYGWANNPIFWNNRDF